MLLLVDTNEAECPYCPPGMQCDPTTNTCVKGSYSCQHCAWSHLILISVFYSCQQTCTYVCIVHISRTYSANYTYDSCLQGTKYSISFQLSCMITKKYSLQTFMCLSKRYLSKYIYISPIRESISFPRHIGNLYTFCTFTPRRCKRKEKITHATQREILFTSSLILKCTLHFLGLYGLSHSFFSRLH